MKGGVSDDGLDEISGVEDIIWMTDDVLDDG